MGGVVGYAQMLKSSSTPIGIVGSATAISPTSGGGARRIATAGPIDTTGSSLIVVAVTDNQAGAAPTLVDSAGNIWPLIRTQTDTVKNRLKMYICVNPTTSASHTFTYSTSNDSFPCVMVLAIRGTSTGTPLDKQNSNPIPAALASGTPGSITPAFNNEIVITAVSAGGNASFPNVPTIGGSYIVSNSQIWVNNYKSAMAYWIQSTATATNPTWTFNGNDTAALMILSFKKS